jgi:hypothetical protein
MNKKEKQYVAAFLLLAVIGGALYANYMGWTAQYGWPKMFETTGGGSNNPPNPPSSKDDYTQGIGVWQLSCKAFDSAAPGTTRTIGTNLNVFFMHFVGGQWTPDSGAYDPASTNYYTSKAVDNGFAWIMVQVPSGQAFYVDYGKMRASDSYISSMMFTDVDGDGKPDFVFQYDLRNHDIPSSGYPVVAFTSYLMTYDSSFTGYNTGSNVTGIGGTTTEKYVESYLALSAEKKAVAMYQFRIKVNTTDDTRVKLEKFTIPGIGQLDGTAFNKVTTDSYTIWTYNIATTFNGADYLLRMPNVLNKYYTNIQLQLTLQSGDVLVFWVYCDYLEAQTGAGKTASQVFSMAYS